MEETSQKPSLVIKQGVCIDDRLRDDTPVPEFLIVANAAGFEWLADFFKACAADAKKLPELHIQSAIEEHRHLDVMWKPVDYKHSDHIEIRLIPFDKRTRKRVLERYQISPETARRDSLWERSADFQRQAEDYLRRAKGT